MLGSCLGGHVWFGTVINTTTVSLYHCHCHAFKQQQLNATWHASGLTFSMVAAWRWYGCRTGMLMTFRNRSPVNLAGELDGVQGPAVHHAGAEPQQR